ncbi:hypothetical protein NEUTE1DRAFT_107566 [Neurospora tetrasperma FGSC 2508]|uniref:Uncharacterized protein n=1 Tax=Neurospora tetrasperma (strain FGSC 2508 / ATCC MYA-4615 / P0657) TaxID=510951 RepID=F8MAY4_NEUT8|nr:uncharacterized protein NEUTE1DRAFT_107566 [Neurospora tetrasperma FGSC 2508]EGO61003.1 hypothetical protein NEUTE1DRAFT_107566 [Neurospora tetrasperma FGSC 2508]EGZ74991.1 hypothetical protein NEUTE2DRAFT_125934 [Neurospora tetrasperma FGSC 2509]
MRPTSPARFAPPLRAPTVCPRPLFLRAATAVRTSTTKAQHASRLFSCQTARSGLVQNSGAKPKIPYAAFSFEHLGISNKWNKYIMVFFITMGTIETYLWYKYLPAWWEAHSNTATEFEKQRDGPQSHTAN